MIAQIHRDIVGSQMDHTIIPVSISGWGRREHNLPQPDQLLGADANTHTTSSCRSRYPLVSNYPTVCVGGLSTAACFHDGGGPVIFAIRDRFQRLVFHLLGVASFGAVPCLSGPSVYSSLNDYGVIGWIRSVAGGQCW